MRKSPVNQSELITKVNVTPIIDVALVLVIILLVTAPLLPISDLPVDLPKATTREAEDESNLSITLGANGVLAVDDERVAATQFQEALARRLAEPRNQNVLVVLRADSSTPYADVERLMSEARAAGARRMAIATRQKPEGQP